MINTYVLSNQCQVCKELQEEFPDLDVTIVEDDIKTFTEIGLIAVPAVITSDQSVYYGAQNFRRFVDEETTPINL